MYADELIDYADKLIKEEEDYESAIQYLTYSQEDFDEGTAAYNKIEKRIQEIDAIKPLLLSSATLTNTNDFTQINIEEGSVSDNIGNIVAPGNLFRSKSDHGGPVHNSYAEVYLGKKYKKLSGEIHVSPNTAEDAKLIFEVYSDDKLIYAEKIFKKTTPITIDLDIENTEWIKIQLSKDDSNEFGELYLSDFKFSTQ